MILNVGSQISPQTQSSQPVELSAEDKQLGDFVSVVLADTEDTWNALFQQAGQRYKEPRLVLFSGQVKSACGFAQAAMGPFYCPADQQVYIDLSFYRDLKSKLNSPGDFAQAYVIAHEVGHHVQKLLGISDQVHAARRQASEKEANQLSVRQELQADCFAGIWANRADRVRGIVEPGDIEEALTAASNIGDDRLQQQSKGYITPDSFTHGSSEQRVRWFRRGYETGKVNNCDTFSQKML
jgi:predicted metalloprotease